MPTNNYPELTTIELQGGGLFDELMRTVKEHLQEEYSLNRIRGADYSKVYLGSMEAVLGNAVQYLTANALLEEQKAKLNAEIQLVQAQTEKERLTAQLIPIEKEKLEAERDLVQVQVERAKYELKYILPLELAKLELEKQRLQLDLQMVQAQIRKIDAEIPLTVAQTSKTNSEIALLGEQLKVTKYQYDKVLPREYEKLGTEIALVRARTDTETANWSDSVNGKPVAGSIGRQNDLYKAQRDGFIRKNEQDLLQIMANVWAAHMNVDEGLNRPPGLGDEDIYAVAQRAAKGIGVIVDADDKIGNPVTYSKYPSD